MDWYEFLAHSLRLLESPRPSIDEILILMNDS
jgi:hypothetical protein